MILLCTLGTTWAVVPEILGWLSEDIVPLYRCHPLKREMDAERDRYSLSAPREVWIATTAGVPLDRLVAWWRLLGSSFALRIFVAESVKELSSAAEVRLFRELILRAALHASSESDVVMSLAGGRKTMSADLQRAGHIFGCRALVHVIETLKPDDPLRNPTARRMTQPLEAGEAAQICPLVVGSGQRADYLDIEPPIVPASFPLAGRADGPITLWNHAGNELQTTLERRERESNALIFNFVTSLSKQESYGNWRSVYRLSPRRVRDLQDTSVVGQVGWLKQLPKAELHRHIGGALTTEQQRVVGRAVWDALPETQRTDALRCVEPLLSSKSWDWSWPERLREGGSAFLRSTRAAALLVHATDEQLQNNLFHAVGRRHDLIHHEQAFSAYERPGELAGSAILGHEAALKPYARAIVESARSEGILYLELRGSPHKYLDGDGLGFLERFRAAIDEEIGAHKRPVVRFIWSLDRRSEATEIGAQVQQALAATERLDGFLVGLDLAGDEGQGDPEQLEPHFAEAFQRCFHITIHAGELPARTIWKAAYHLHADRIGHGLNLIDEDDLMRRIRERRVCLELCPTSNMELLGYEPGQDRYPLRTFMREEVPVTICTDNPGFSNSTLMKEFEMASHLTPGGLSKFEALAIVRNGFRHAFAPLPERKKLLLEADEQVFSLLTRFSN